MKSTGSWYVVIDGNQRAVMCRTKGKLRLDDSHETNPVAVGDRVEFDNEGENGVITKILPRRNHILRQSVKKSSHSHVLAANVDQVLLLATIREPRTSLGFIDRFLISAESFRIPQLILFNKNDILTPDEIKEQESIIKLYSSLKVNSKSISAINDDLSRLKDLFAHKITLLAGHSGAGKSTFLNRIAPHVSQAVGKISDFSSKGTHTTTFAEMFPVGIDSYIIDTPGIKEWGLVDMAPQEISDYFVEMRELRHFCKFGSRCLHLTEPHCAILNAVKDGSIAQTRYDNYVSMVEGKDNRK